MRRGLRVLAIVVACAAALALLAHLVLWAGVGFVDPDESTLAREVPAVPQARDCLRLTRSNADYFSAEAMQKARDARAAACRAAHAERPDDVEIMVALAQAIGSEDRPQTLALLRKAAAANSAVANYEIYEQYKSWDQRGSRPDLVSRAEAEQGLRRAAELGHPYSMMMLAILLERGGPIRRSPTEAAAWAARAMENPPPESSRADIAVLLGRLLASSSDADERARGLAMLERLAENGPFNGKTMLARAIRADDPVRARALLEAALRPDPGGAPPLLADMLIKGEGGPADPRRAVKLVSVSSDVGAMRGALGRLMLAGELVPRDVPKAIGLLRSEAVWDTDVRIMVVGLVARHPEVRIDYADRFLYDAGLAAELDEPGATEALIALRLSQHPQFRDVTDGCRWLSIARSRGLVPTEEQQTACARGADGR